MDARARFFARMEDEHKYQDDYDGMSGLEVDFRVTESGRTTLNNDDDDTLDGMDFSMLGSARALGNTDRSMQTVNTIDTNYTEGTIGTATSSILDSRSTDKPSDRSGESSTPDEKLAPMGTRSSSKKNQHADREQKQPQQQQQGFQPLLPLPEHATRQRSAPRAIPKAAASQTSQALNLGPSASQPSSAGSTASTFLNNLLDPAATTFNNTHMSHTPPNQISTSYEASHFGKRARSGVSVMQDSARSIYMFLLFLIFALQSVSERLKVSTELEQKGMIDREQKGILKDLIISGQDNELQHALDLYEQGDTALLEAMLQNGSLANRAKNDIDLLGDLDLDFLNVSDAGMGELTSQNIAYVPSANPMNPPPGLPTRDQAHAMASDGDGHDAGAFEASDGIGELDFDGGIGGTDTFGPINTNYRIPSPMYHPGQRSRSNSTFSLDLDYRQRSNSLFSALIGNVTPQEGTPVEYGRWMERQQGIHDPSRGGGVMIDRAPRRASAPETPSNLSISMAIEEKKLNASERKELKAEEKRRERLEKKEQKEKEKREKKEKREQAKIDKQRKDDEDDEMDEHVPGCGRPRSMSDPNIRAMIDDDGLLHVERPDGWIGAYSPESRKVRISRFLEKRNHRVWTKTVKYDVRKNFADSRLRVKGRFVKKEDELMMRELMSLT